MPQRHFHVDSHDVGYNPYADAVSTHLTIDGAIWDALAAAEQHIEHLATLDPDQAIRGQTFSTKPITNAAEVEAVERQIHEITMLLNTEDYTAEVAKKGLLIVLDHGVAVIELTPCSEDTCETYRKDWIE
jgi:hypothetical protein